MTRPDPRAMLTLTSLEDRTTPTYFTPDLIRQAYDIDFRFATAGGHVVPADGRGQTIAVVNAYRNPNVRADLQAFSRHFGLPDPVLVEVGQHLADPTRLPGPPPADDEGWLGEAVLDVQWAHAVAPGAAILLVEADSPALTDMFQAVDVARRYTPPGLAPVSVVSMSFGTPSEYPEQTIDNRLFTTPAGHPGITFVAATGDDYGPGGYAAYSPNVLAVGGTRLEVDGDGNWVAEHPWRAVVGGEVQGTAGGFSRYEPQPGYQLGVHSTGKRGIPDVAYNGDPATGFYVYDSAGDPDRPWAVIGGTSAGTPQWAGLVALANQGRALAGRGPLDGPTQTLPFVYGLPDDAFHVLARPGEEPGWNIDTGRGSPIASRVVAGLLVGTGVSVVDTDVPLTPDVPPPPAPPPPPPAATPAAFAVGEGEGGESRVTVFAADGTELLTFDAYEAAFTGGVRVVLADVTGDGRPDVVAAPGPGREPEVRVFDAGTGRLLRAFLAFESSFEGGVNLSAGHLTGREASDVVVSADLGGGPRVRVLDAVTGTAFADFFGIEDPAFRGGARTAVGDLNRDGLPDLAVAAGFGGGPRVAAYDGKTLGPASAPVRLFGDFFAFEQTLRNGVHVTLGDLDGDGFAELVAGGGPGGGPRVTAFSGKALLANRYEPVANFFAGDPRNRGGVRLTAKDLDGDDRADLLVGSGEEAGSRVTGYYGRAVPPVGSPAQAFTFDAFDGFPGGVFVG